MPTKTNSTTKPYKAQLTRDGVTNGYGYFATAQEAKERELIVSEQLNAGKTPEEIKAELGIGRFTSKAKGVTVSKSKSDGFRVHINIMGVTRYFGTFGNEQEASGIAQAVFKLREAGLDYAQIKQSLKTMDVT